MVYFSKTMFRREASNRCFSNINILDAWSNLFSVVVAIATLLPVSMFYILNADQSGGCSVCSPAHTWPDYSSWCKCGCFGKNRDRWSSEMLFSLSLWADVVTFILIWCDVDCFFFIWVSKSWLPPVTIKAFLWFCQRRAPRVKQEQEEPLQLVCIKEGGNGDRLTTLRCLNRLQVLQGEGKSADCCQHLWEVYSCSLQDTLPWSCAGPHTSLNTTNQARICQTRSRNRGKICHISLLIALMQDNLCWIHPKHTKTRKIQLNYFEITVIVMLKAKREWQWYNKKCYLLWLTPFLSDYSANLSNI